MSKRFKFTTVDDFCFKEITERVLLRFEGKKRGIPEWLFKMYAFSGHTCKRNKCGTFHCIGGWIDLESGGTGNTSGRQHFPNMSEAVYIATENLFFNWPTDEDETYGPNRKGAARAIRRFLRGESAPWNFKLKKDERTYYVKAD